MVATLCYFLTFLSGLFVGSFLNLVSDRAPFDKPIFLGRSRCDHCKAILKAKDLMPLLSFALLKAKCRYCGKKLSFTYPLSEILTGLAFFGAAYYLQLFNGPTMWKWVNFVYLAVAVGFFIIIFLADVKYRLIPNSVVHKAIGFVILFIVITSAVAMTSYFFQLKNDAFGRYLIQAGYWNTQLMYLLKSLGLTLISALGIGLFFWFLIWVTKGRGMGGGDVKLAFLIGIMNGWPINLVAIFLGFVFGAIFSLILVALRKKTMKDTVPFGPFLILGSITAFVFGNQILKWYTGLI